ncbi:MAG TPA: TolC family protein [Vicinamibacterales bacterium]|nr:TolC family protein [Vicinamibacterales bacterium]
MNRWVGAASFVLSMLLASTSAAQTTASFLDAVNGLSLDEAIARGLAQEPSLRAARTAIDVARGTRLQAGLRKNPSLSAEFRGEPSGTDNQTMVNVEWPLDLFRREGREGVADREITATELAVADRQRLLAADVRARFGEALAAVRDLAILDELVDASRRQHDLLRSRVDEGASSPIERDVVDVELRRLNADRSLQLGRVERAMFELKRILGASPDDTVRLREALEDVVNRESVAVSVAAVADQRPDVREAAARVAVADARIDRAQREGRFDMAVFAGYTRMDSGFPQFGLSPTGVPERVQGLFHYVTAGATVTLPMFDRNQGEVAAARAERLNALALQEAAELTAKTEIAAARSLNQRAHEAVRLYAGDARTLARQNLSVVRQSYELGRATIFEVLAEQKRYLDLERAYTETLRAAYEARTALNRALGEMR